MFTGIIQKVGKVISIEKMTDEKNGEAIQMRITNPYGGTQSTDPIQMGESIANNGVCLTVTAFDPQVLQFDISPATLEVTALGRLKVGSLVNLERSMRMGDRLSGHWVQGHVDGVAEVVKIEAVEEGFYNVFLRPRETKDSPIFRYCVKKGSLTVEGISLTIQDMVDDSLASSGSVAKIRAEMSAETRAKTLKFQIIPHTWAETGLRDLKNGDLVNIEVDILAKYLERMMQKDL